MAKGGHKRARFLKLVSEMWQRRSSRLLAAVGKKRKGPRAQFGKKYRMFKIQAIQEIAAELEEPKLRSTIERKTSNWIVRFSKGLRNEQKWRVLRSRASRWPHGRHLVYIVWDSRGRCSKVGRSDVGLKRLYAQRDTYYFRQARSISVYFPKARRRSSLLALECGLTHLFRPNLYRVKPSQRKYCEKCPICQVQKQIKQEIQRIFPLRQRRRRR